MVEIKSLFRSQKGENDRRWDSKQSIKREGEGTRERNLPCHSFIN